MKSDFGQISIEQPRINSRAPNKQTREKVNIKIWETYEDLGWDGSSRRPMSIKANPIYKNYDPYNSKELTDFLSPLNRFLMKSVGRPVNDVRHEICQVLGKSRESWRHILTVHFEDNLNPRYARSDYSDCFWEDQFGILRYNPRKPYRRSRKEKEAMKPAEKKINPHDSTYFCQLCLDHLKLKKLEKKNELRRIQSISL